MVDNLLGGCILRVCIVFSLTSHIEWAFDGKEVRIYQVMICASDDWIVMDAVQNAPRRKVHYTAFEMDLEISAAEDEED